MFSYYENYTTIDRGYGAVVFEQLVNTKDSNPWQAISGKLTAMALRDILSSKD